MRSFAWRGNCRRLVLRGYRDLPVHSAFLHAASLKELSLVRRATPRGAVAVIIVCVHLAAAAIFTGTASHYTMHPLLTEHGPVVEAWIGTTIRGKAITELYVVTKSA